MSRKGVFISNITVEMFKKATLESVEEFMASGQMEDIEISERPHGEWVQVTAKDGEYYCYHKCTNCGQTIESGFDNPPLFNFCPKCGARMSAKEENNE